MQTSVNDQAKRKRRLFRTPRYGLLWLFVLTTIVALIAGVYSRRKSALDLEMMTIAGTWDSANAEGFDVPSDSFNFEDSRFRIVSPGLLEVKLANKDVVYGAYRRDGNLLYYTESLVGFSAPENADDDWPAVEVDAPLPLYSADKRVSRYLLRLTREKESATENDMLNHEGAESGWLGQADSEHEFLQR